MNHSRFFLVTFFLSVAGASIVGCSGDDTNPAAPPSSDAGKDVTTDTGTTDTGTTDTGTTDTGTEDTGTTDTGTTDTGTDSGTDAATDAPADAPADG